MNKFAMFYDVDLELCQDVDELNKWLEINGYTTIEDQIKFLKGYMCVFASNFCGGDFSEEEDCATLKDMYIDGEWRAMSGKYRNKEIFAVAAK
jgi:hypothetical protein